MEEYASRAELHSKTYRSLRARRRSDDPAYLKKEETFESWYENPIDLPGRWYLQAIVQLFKENRLAKGASKSGIPEAARVAKGPGLMACTRIPLGPSSAA